MMESALPPGEQRFGPGHKIVAGTLLVAALAGVGITALDYPWRFGGARSLPDAAGRRMPAPLALATTLPSANTQAATQAATAAPIAQAKAERHRTKRRSSEARSSARTMVRPPQRTPSIDAEYEAAVKAQCPAGAAGFFCQEAVRWRLCSGRWNDGRVANATRCAVKGTHAEFPSLG